MSFENPMGLTQSARSTNELDARRQNAPVKTASRRQVEEHESKVVGPFIDPIALSKLKAAITAKPRRKTVVLRGIEFAITYDIVLKLPVTGDREVIKVERVDGGTVPFAHVSVARILAFDWED